MYNFLVVSNCILPILHQFLYFCTPKHNKPYKRSNPWECNHLTYIKSVIE